MNNDGGKIPVTGEWVLVIEANPARTQATVQNTSLGAGPEFDRFGINNGPPVWVWAGTTDPRTLTGGPADIGAQLLAKPGDGVAFAGTATQAAIYAWAERPGSSVSATEY